MTEQLEPFSARLGEEWDRTAGAAWLLRSIRATGTDINSDQARDCHSTRSVSGLCHSFWGCANTYKKVLQRFVPYKLPKNLEKPRDLGDNILLPVSPLPVWGMDLSCG